MFLVSCCNLQLAKFLPAQFSEKISRTNGRISFFGQASFLLLRLSALIIRFRESNHVKNNCDNCGELTGDS
jgi:hypothetical protein